jgi:thiamine kinase-like enzyme
MGLHLTLPLPTRKHRKKYMLKSSVKTVGSKTNPVQQDAAMSMNVLVNSSHQGCWVFCVPAFLPTHSTLIHADLHADNLLWHGQNVMALDFDACGFGALGFDLATALGYLETEVRPSFLEGYESLRPLPSDFADHKSRYTIAEWLSNLSFLAPRDFEREYIENVMLQGLRQQLPALMQH